MKIMSSFPTSNPTAPPFLPSISQNRKRPHSNKLPCNCSWWPLPRASQGFKSDTDATSYPHEAGIRVGCCSATPGLRLKGCMPLKHGRKSLTRLPVPLGTVAAAESRQGFVWLPNTPTDSRNRHPPRRCWELLGGGGASVQPGRRKCMQVRRSKRHTTALATTRKASAAAPHSICTKPTLVPCAPW